jgi:hypothetical protein
VVSGRERGVSSRGGARTGSTYTYVLMPFRSRARCKCSKGK